MTGSAATSGGGLLVDGLVQAFWTMYDPLDLASTSLDPLGFARGYLALADRFLPSFTTVTTIPRYVSMLCAALKAVQTHLGFESDPGHSKVREERLKAVKSYERAWALACGLAARDEAVGERAIRGLRGIRYVNRRLDTLSPREKYIQTGSFNLLSNQVRYGGIGVYATFLEQCHLALMRGLTLRPLGEALAEQFPGPPPNLPVHNEDARLSLEALKEWGSLAHVAAFTTGEGTVMAQALQGGEEVDLADRVRWASIRIFATAKPRLTYEEGELFRDVARGIRNGKLNNLGIPPACLTQIEASLQMLEPFEQFYQGLIFLFDRIRGAASDEAEASLADLGNSEPIREAAEAIRKSAEELPRILVTARAVNATIVMEVEAVLKESGILALAADILSEAPDTCELMRIVLRRHNHVQSGKFDKGLAKAPWVRLTKVGDCVQLTAQRYQVAKSQRPAGWKDVGRHPYRTESAFAFIRACNMNVG